MTPDIPNDLLQLAAEWDDLHRWERKQLGLALRRLGLTYSEIQTIVPLPKGTLSLWGKEVELSPSQVESIRQRTGPHNFVGVPRDTQARRRHEIEHIRSEARSFAESHLDDARFVGGAVLYWGEGSKTRNFFDLTNTDPAALRYFIRWVREYMDASAEFKLGLHLHEANDEAAARRYWSEALNLPSAVYGKTYIKPAGTGHRKNHLPHGVCRVRTLRASNYWQRVMVWIDVVAGSFGPVDDSPW
ncbi:MAG: hypothetical protein O3B42_04225 [Actinomycetota bacterium]|nr:hypothetical protein [Actinomycetota bacterium]